MRLVLAIVAAAAVILSAPFVSQIRFWIRSTFPGHFVLVVGGLIGTTLGAAVLAAVLRIRDRRLLRYGAIAAALAIGATYSVSISTPDPQANAVERFHFVEYGLVTFLFYRAWRPIGDRSLLVLPVLAGLLVGTLEEWFQWFLPIRIGEMRDVFLNLAAIVCGLLFSLGVDPPRQLGLSWRPGSRRRICLLAGLVVLAFAAFVHVVHLGYTIVDHAAGTFTSRYTAPELAALSHDRQARWAATPPMVRRLSREDQYLSEGILHVQERNRRWDAGDAWSAWHENLILDTYYAAVLDTTYPQPSGSVHRWSAEHEAAARQLVAADGQGTYVSRADGGFIRTWSRTWLWSVAVLLAASSVVGGFVVDRRPAHVSSRT